MVASHPTTNTVPEADNTCCGMDIYKIKKATLVMRSLDHPIRKKIMSELSESNTLNVTDLYKKLDMEQSVLSQHLAVLRRSGLVTQQRKGKFINYSINRKRIQKITEMLDLFLS